MYDIFTSIINHTWDTTSSISTYQQLVITGCIVLIIVLFVVIIDLTYRVFRHFWR